MAIFAETLVEEWLNREGYFTVRGAKAGLLEMDLLAVRPGTGGVEALHYEVQASTGPISWMTPWTPALREELGIASSNARGRTPGQLAECVEAWVAKKFADPRVEKVRERLWPGASWGFVLVAGVVRHPKELEEIRSRGVRVLDLASVLDELTGPNGNDRPIKTTSSTAADIAAVIGLDRKLRPGEDEGVS